MESESQLIKSFYEQLDEELQNFTLPADKLIETYDYIEFEYINGDIAGIGGLTVEHSLFLIIKKVHQNKGLSQVLLRKIIQKAIERNYACIQLSVVKTNQVAVHIYKKCGFKIIASVNVDGKDSYYMIKPLSFRGYLFMLHKKLGSHVPKSIRRRIRQT